jgi:hypothetical protein
MEIFAQSGVSIFLNTFITKEPGYGLGKRGIWVWFSRLEDIFSVFHIIRPSVKLLLGNLSPAVKLSTHEFGHSLRSSAEVKKIQKYNLRVPARLKKWLLIKHWEFSFNLYWVEYWLADRGFRFWFPEWAYCFLSPLAFCPFWNVTYINITFETIYSLFPLFWNKNLWEELIAHFRSIRHGPHTKRRLQNIIRCRGSVFKEPLPNNDKRDAHKDTV